MVAAEGTTGAADEIDWTYTHSHDVISQAVDVATAHSHYFRYDGHGSTRGLEDTLATGIDPESAAPALRRDPLSRRAR